MSIIGISSIHLLKTFIGVGTLGGLPLCTPDALHEATSQIGSAACTAFTHEGVMWQTIIHCVFILSAIGITWADRLMSNGSSASKAH